MSSLNVKCSICSEFYKVSDRIYSTFCGHLFHYNCLNRWLTRYNNCPQCRRSCHRHRIHRVYLDYDVAGCQMGDDTDGSFESSNIPIWVPLDEPMGPPGLPEDTPQGGILIGQDNDGNDVYVARAYYEDDLLPANYIPKKGGAYAPYGCSARLLRQDVEILIDCKCKWVADTAGHVPEDAIVTGYSENGENLYTARAKHNGILLGGKVHPSHRVCYMPYDGKEVNSSEYEVLVLDKSDNQTVGNIEQNVTQVQ